MIEHIHIAKEGSYDADGVDLEGLKLVNFIFGSNGSGKTTISRVIQSPEGCSDCTVRWRTGHEIEALVYNRDFVERHFNSNSAIKGVYTFGDNNEVLGDIARLKDETTLISDKIQRAEINLNGEDGSAGARGRLKELEEQFTADIWNVKSTIGYKQLKAVFKGLNSDKQKFRDAYDAERLSNMAELREVGPLIADAETIFSDELQKVQLLPYPGHFSVYDLEDSGLLGKKVIGKQDVDIGALIESLDISDWVREGVKHFDQLDHQCPFCQQKTPPSFKDSIEAFFDKTYLEDIAQLEALLTDYKERSSKAIEAYDVDNLSQSTFIDDDEYGKSMAALQAVFDANIETLKQKIRGPSIAVELRDTRPSFKALDDIIKQANAKITAQNDAVSNLETLRGKLKAQVWRCFFEDTEIAFQNYQREAKELELKIKGLEGSLNEFNKSKTAKKAEISRLEAQVTSVKPTITAINTILADFGFMNFSLAEAEEDGQYQIKRPDGTDANHTLSEGEKSFITFLYFFHSIQGAFEPTELTEDRVVVFDDPVSSLDGDVLFIVRSLMNKIIDPVLKGESLIKQVFVLTHNVYFHKEITYKREFGLKVGYWIVRKLQQRSEIIPCEVNPIKSSYELLWHEIRQASNESITIQNTMRRILEHYFRFFGGIELKDISKDFEGADKLIFNSLMHWVNDGSHTADDDLYIACDAGQIERYKFVFQKIFENSNHAGHYKMMMGDAYQAIKNQEPGQ